MTSPTNQFYLAIAIVQSQDERLVSNALQKAGYEIVSVATHGALLGRRNSTLLIYVSQARLHPFLEIIQKYCHERTEYIATPLEGTPLPIPISTPITIGGATVFFIPIDYYEELS
ncbi:MAG: cyclic-di-AMP receptor [Anaerolineales bacterium]